jgi:uncharacterized protein (DUF433 family)
VSDETTVQSGSKEALPQALIVKTPGCCGGKARIRGRRVPVWLVADWDREGHSVSGILEFLPYLSAEEVQAALQYAQRHPDEINLDIKLNEEA